MIDLANSQFFLATKEFRRLTILLAINHTPNISQQAIAKCSNLSGAMVNNYMKELVHEGLVLVTNRNKRDRDYLITDRGRQKLFLLLMRCSAEIVQLYAQAKNELLVKFTNLFSDRKPHRIVLFGGAETACMVIQAIHRFPQAEIAGIVDSDSKKWNTSLEGHTITPPDSISTLSPDTIIISSFARQDEIYASIKNLSKKGINIVKLSSL